MSFRYNYSFDITSASPEDLNIPAFGPPGSNTFMSQQITGWQGNASQYTAVRYLAGKTHIYYVPYRSELSEQPAGVLDSPGVVTTYPYRYWQTFNIDDQTLLGSTAHETPPSIPTTGQELWSKTAEYPGVKFMFLPTIYSLNKVRSQTFKYTQASFKDVGANPVGFNQDLDIEKDSERAIPNRAYIRMYLDQSFGGTILNGTRFRVYVSYTYTVMFSGKKLINPV